MPGNRAISNGTQQACTNFTTPESSSSPFALKDSEFLASIPSTRQVFIVLVDDNPADVLLVREALAWHKIKADLTVARDGDEAISMVEEIDAQLLPSPDLMILDLNLPRKTGFDVLERMRTSERCGQIPVAVLSSSAAPTDQQRAERLGASRYFQKPSNLRDFMSIGARLREMLLPFNN